MWKNANVQKAKKRCALHIESNSFWSMKRPRITIQIWQGTRHHSCRGYILTLTHMRRTDGFYFNISQHSGHCGHCETYCKQPPPSLASSESSRLRHHRACFETLYRLPLTPLTPHVGRGPEVLSVKSKALPPAVWRSPLPPEPLVATCEGGELVIFLIILHFISIPPFKTQRENWLPQRFIFIISPRPINYPTFGAGWTSCEGRAEPRPRRLLGEPHWMGLLFSPAGSGREKKYTCYLVNPQTCKIGMSWMSATEMELTRDLFIVTEGH